MRKRASILAKMSQYTAGKETLDMEKKTLGYELLLNTGRIEVGKTGKMVFTEGITVLKDYAEVSGGWDSVWVAPGNLGVNFCESSLLLGCRVGKCRINGGLPFCCYCRGPVE